MQRNLATRTVGTFQRIGGVKKRYLAAAGALTLAVAAGTCTGIWLSAGHSGGRTAVQQQSAGQAGVGQSEVTAPAAVQPLSGVPQTFTVYLVGSQAAATELQHELTRSATKLDGGGQPQNEAILVADSTQAAADARLAVKELQLDYGSGNVHVQDLRRPASDRGVVPARSPETATVYLVDSQAAANALVHELTRDARKLAGEDWSKSNEQVLVLGSAEDRGAARATLKDLQLTYGAENVHVHDLRTTEAPLRQADPAQLTMPVTSLRSAPTQDTSTVYLVGTPEEAAQQAADIEAANMLREQLGQGPLRDVLWQAAPGTPDTAARQAIADENALRASLGLPEVAVVDLRPSPQ